MEAIPEELATPVTRPGDVWLIGKHRSICGDCRDRNILGILFPRDARANLVMPRLQRGAAFDTTPVGTDQAQAPAGIAMGKRFLSSTCTLPNR
ncbi:MAG: hypothetical protein C5B51_25285 [Terriglobia bacterium]|nr:MAG: hypothetical protein C5B51_25285 [Terriglobia bacterium]